MFIVSEQGISMATYDTYESIFECESRKAGLIIGRGGEQIKSLAKECGVHIGKAHKDGDLTRFKISGNVVHKVEKAYLKMKSIVEMKKGVRVEVQSATHATVNMCDVVRVHSGDNGKKRTKSVLSRSRKAWWNAAKKNMKKSVMLGGKNSDYYWGVVRRVVMKNF